MAKNTRSVQGSAERSEAGSYKTSSKILDRIEAIEKSLQRLKIETYFSLPEKTKKFLYPEKSLRKAIRSLRKSIWQERYAKKV